MKRKPAREKADYGNRHRKPRAHPQPAEVARAIPSVFECASRSAAEQRLKEIIARYAKSASKLVGPDGATQYTVKATLAGVSAAGSVPTRRGNTGSL